MTDSSLAAALQDRYVLERELGHGGMATVYLARDLKHKRSVALKVLRPELAATLGPDRFRREIETAAGLQHPHICSVYDSGETAGRLWFTMPYVRGETLRERLRREGRLPVEQTLRITTEAGRALDYAHREGFVHRDVKPENLLLTTDGDTLVADFGIARVLANAASEAEEHLTETGVAVGTAAYMAPEQATGERTVDARADQYALAATCYEMLAGHPPFSGPTAAAIIAERFRGPPSKVRASRPEVPEALDRALQRALALNPDDRFGSMSDLVDALNQGARSGSGITLHLPTIRRQRRVRLVVGLLIAALLVAGTFILRRRGTSPAGEIQRSLSVTRLAVLPFENRGAAEDAYFADGVADEVRGKLAGLAGFQITARTSSDQYRRTTKSPQEIGRELGVSYLLSATLRWAKGARGASRVEVLPELIDIHTGAVTWQKSYDADLTDIFQVQTQIATWVAEALGVALGSREKRQLAEQPTTNLDAYDLYLKAGSISAGVRPAISRQRIALLEHAVALDSTFANAWASLSSNLSNLYSNGVPDPAVAMRSLAAAERAVRLDPEGPSGHRALAEYHYAVTRDAARAEEQIVLGLRNSPSDPRLLRAAANIERQLGRYDEALAHLQQAQRIDPRSVGVLNVLQVTLLWLRRYPEALAASNAALALAPGDLSLTQDKSMVYLAQGDLVGARHLIAGLSPTVPDSEVAAYFAQYWDLYWVLEDAQQRRIFRLTPASFDNDRSAWASALMQLYWLRGDRSRARTYADTAYKASVLQMREAPDDAQRKVLAGLQLAYLGRKEEAIAMGLRGTALAPLAQDKINGPYYQHQLARIYLLVSEPERALDALAPLLKTPYYLSPGWLRIDPTFASLRGNHRYDQMVEGS